MQLRLHAILHYGTLKAGVAAQCARRLHIHRRTTPHPTSPAKTPALMHTQTAAESARDLTKRIHAGDCGGLRPATAAHVRQTLHL